MSQIALSELSQNLVQLIISIEKLIFDEIEIVNLNLDQQFQKTIIGKK